MFIILGPDGAGKSVLAQRLSTLTGLRIVHFTKNSKYEDYLGVLVNVDEEVICDRFIWCEVPYSYTRKGVRTFQFTPKQFHNSTLLGLMRNPLVILCSHKPSSYDEEVLPMENWDECLAGYRRFLSQHWIPCMDYDYDQPTLVEPGGTIVDTMVRSHKHLASGTEWWKAMWRSGRGAVGSCSPDILLVAERIGPNNVNNIPFETGPTGYMLSEVLGSTKTPLGRIAITNMVKDVRRSTRGPNDADFGLFKEELEKLEPQGIIFMGRTAQAGIRVAKAMGIDYRTIPHLGYLHHSGIRDLRPYCNEWSKIWKDLTGNELA